MAKAKCLQLFPESIIEELVDEFKTG